MLTAMKTFLLFAAAMSLPGCAPAMSTDSQTERLLPQAPADLGRNLDGQVIIANRLSNSECEAVVSLDGQAGTVLQQGKAAHFHVTFDSHNISVRLEPACSLPPPPELTLTVKTGDATLLGIDEAGVHTLSFTEESFSDMGQHPQVE
ncbi:hypothetical protein D3M70_26625 [Pseudomonas sp. LS-2]|jgi:hypothetical protein|nr:hypothetical protein D3M70_26625 [Pseudomonas sp. LS-2]